MLATHQYGVFKTPGTEGRPHNGTARLTRKEAQLLALLQQNAGHCLSREYLLATVWGYQNGTRTRTLDVHIQRLRRKLGADGPNRITTVLRNGYAWQDEAGSRKPLT